jgi:hypothetical protein
MDELGFEWDPGKASANHRKHGVGFIEATSAFVDENALLLADPDHSSREDRFLLLGMSDRVRLLVVSHTYRSGGDVIRIVSARNATRREARLYVWRWLG